MHAIIETGGKQYEVKKGQKLQVEKLDSLDGSEIEFDVLALLGDKPQFGQPLVKGAKVKAKVSDQTLGSKITVSTYKRRKGYHKKQGHRQKLTQLEIIDITA